MSCGGIQYVPGQFYGNGQDNLRGLCSGNGDCIAGVCVCDDGWTSLTDFFGLTNSDCAISVLGIQIEYGLLLAITLVTFLLSIKGLKKRYKDYVDAKAKAAQRGRSYNITNNRAGLSMVIWHGFGTPCIIATCILRIFFPEERVGVTIPLTVLFLITKTAFYVCSLVYQPYLFKILMRGDSTKANAEVKKLIKFVNIAGIIGCLVSVAGGFIPFVSIANQGAATGVFTGYYYLSAFGLFYNASMALAIYHKAEKLLSHSYSQTKEQRVLTMKKKMKGFQIGVVKNAGVFGLIYVIMALWPFWWNLHDYFHGITWVVFIKVSVDIANGTLERGASKSGPGSASPKVDKNGASGTIETKEEVSMSV